MYNASSSIETAAPEPLLRLAARTVPFATWSVQARTLRIAWSGELRTILEVGPGYEPTALEVLGFIAPEWRDAASCALGEALRRGTAFDLELEAIGARGTRSWVRLAGEAVRGADGAVEQVLGVAQDVSRMRQLVEENRRAGDRLRQDAQRLRTTLNRLTDGFGTINHDWHVTFANPAAVAVLQKTPEQLQQGDIWTLFPGLEDTPFAGFYRRAMAGTRQEMEGYYPPLERWLRARAFPIEEGIAVCFTDITEARNARLEVLQLNLELERRVEERTAELERATRDLESFAYMLAHDLKAPIAAVQGFSATLEEREPALGERSRHYLQRVRHAAGQMDEITDAILDLSRLSFVPLAREDLDLSAMAREVLRDLAEAYPGRAVEWEVQPDLQARGDRALLQLVLQNLLSNAWKYSGPAAHPRIAFGVERAEGGPAFFVRDNGIGFDAGVVPRLFRPFSRLHGTDFAGTGVGLASVEKIVARHGGRVWALAQPGTGATFFFTLPDA